jgi:pheromone a factor receptor
LSANNIFAALILIRLHRYRRNFTALLANSNTNKSRFARLFAICISWLLISIPLQMYFIKRAASVAHVPFDWALVHDMEFWGQIEKKPSNGSVIYTRYVWMLSALMVFVFFGFGRDAGKMYARGLRAVGLGNCLPFLKAKNQTPVRSTSQSGTINSVGSKAKLMFGRKSISVKSWGTDSGSSKATSSSMAEPLSPKTAKHLETVQESFRGPTFPAPVAGAFSSRLPTWFGGRRNGASDDVEKNLPATPKHAGFHRLTSPFRPVVAKREPAVPMHNIMRTQDITVQSVAVADRV